MHNGRRRSQWTVRLARPGGDCGPMVLLELCRVTQWLLGWWIPGFKHYIWLLSFLFLPANTCTACGFGRLSGCCSVVGSQAFCQISFSAAFGLSSRGDYWNVSNTLSGTSVAQLFCPKAACLTSVSYSSSTLSCLHTFITHAHTWVDQQIPFLVPQSFV